jgi:hypothetical protein
MKVNLNIEEDEQFRKYVKDMIAGQVRGFLRAQLSGVVAGEIAKLRLLQPDSTTLSDMVSKQVKGMVDSHVRGANIPKMVQADISRAVADAVAPLMGRVKEIIAEEVAKAIRL